MAGKKLARHVTVAGVTYGPDDDVPADVMSKITNPKAWQPLTADTTDDNDEPKGKAGTSSGARLATAVTVGGRTYLPTEPLPDDVAAQIRNPKAWEGGKVPSAARASTAKTSSGGEGTGDGGTKADATAKTETGGDSQPVKATPRASKSAATGAAKTDPQ